MYCSAGATSTSAGSAAAQTFRKGYDFLVLSSKVEEAKRRMRDV